jgi:hypothetical protein
MSDLQLNLVLKKRNRKQLVVAVPDKQTDC